MSGHGALFILSDGEVDGDGTLSDRAYHLFRHSRVVKYVKEKWGQHTAGNLEELYHLRAALLGPRWFDTPMGELGNAETLVKDLGEHGVDIHKAARAAKFGTIRDMVQVALSEKAEDYEDELDQLGPSSPNMQPPPPKPKSKSKPKEDKDAESPPEEHDDAKSESDETPEDSGTGEGDGEGEEESGDTEDTDGESDTGEPESGEPADDGSDSDTGGDGESVDMDALLEECPRHGRCDP